VAWNLAPTLPKPSKCLLLSWKSLANSARRRSTTSKVRITQLSEASSSSFCSCLYLVLSLNPVDITSLGRLGKRALLRGDYTEALSKYKQIINQNPKPYHQFAYLDVGYIHWKYGATLKVEALPFY